MYIKQISVAVSMTLSVALIGCSLLVSQTVSADEISGYDAIDIYGDFRFRMETDWDSARSSGVERDDRLRARVRGRIGLKIKPTKHFEFNARLRSGSRLSQQSPHITVHDFDNNSHGDADFIFDKWYMTLKNETFWGWVGRNGLPFWKQNELFWDDDATVAGVAGGAKVALGSA